MKRVAIQGIQGSNHYIVAQNYFEKDTNIKECLSFDALVHAVVSEECIYGIMALENTIAGSIIPNYALIDQYNLTISGEYYLNIHHHLMALENQQTEDIQEVYSHPMALLQCKEFFKQHPNIKLIEDVDTADVAKRISEQQLKHTAAIAPKIASEIFNLAILEDEIQTITNNATRFVIVQKGDISTPLRQAQCDTLDKTGEKRKEKEDTSTPLSMTKNTRDENVTLSLSKGLKAEANTSTNKHNTVTEALEVNTSTTQQINTGNEPVEVLSKGLEVNKSTNPHIHINKASLKFELDHKRGSLAAMLNVMSDCQLNLTKIQSLPKIETPWKYAFFVDVTFEEYQDYAKAKAIIEIMALEFKILGEYTNGRSHSDLVNQ